MASEVSLDPDHPVKHPSQPNLVTPTRFSLPEYLRLTIGERSGDSAAVGRWGYAPMGWLRPHDVRSRLSCTDNSALLFTVTSICIAACQSNIVLECRPFQPRQWTLPVNHA